MRNKRKDKRKNPGREKHPGGVSRHWPWVSVVVLLLSAYLVYSGTFRSPFHLDDFSSIVWNGAVHDAGNLAAIWAYSPTRFVTYLSFALNYHFHLLDVQGYHVFNLLVHIGAGLAAWWLLLLTFRTPVLADSPYRSRAPWIALFVGLIVVVHPVQTQAVTYIVQRAASMATAFYLLSLALYASGRLELLRGARARTVVYSLGALVTGLMAMFSKETAYTLPAALLLYELFFFQGERIARLRVMSIVLFFSAVLVGIYLLNIVPIPEAPNITRTQYLLTQFRVVVTYLRLLLVPIGQNVDYDFPISTRLDEPAVVASLLVLLGLLSLGVRLHRAHRIMSFGIVWFFLTLSPESSIIPIDDVIFEHRLYLPMFGFAIFVVPAIYASLRTKPASLAHGLLAACVVAFGVLAHERNKVWSDELRLVTDIIEKSPGKPRAYSSRAQVFVNRGEYDRALVDLDRAIALDPTFFDAYLNRGTAYALKGEREKAMADFNKALEIDSTDQRVLANRANLLVELNRYSEAIRDYNRAVEFQPNNPLIYSNRGLVYFRMGAFQRALEDYNTALRLNPGLIEAYYNRSLAYYRSGQRELAISDVRRLQEMGYQVNPEYLKLLYE